MVKGRAKAVNDSLTGKHVQKQTYRTVHVYIRVYVSAHKYGCMGAGIGMCTCIGMVTGMSIQA